LNVKKNGQFDAELQGRNDLMYSKYPTPYQGMAGIIERSRVRTVLKMAHITANDAVLEIGCKCGNLLARITTAKRIVEADISQAALASAEAKLKDRIMAARCSAAFR